MILLVIMAMNGDGDNEVYVWLSLTDGVSTGGTLMRKVRFVSLSQSKGSTKYYVDDSKRFFLKVYSPFRPVSATTSRLIKNESSALRRISDFYDSLPLDQDRRRHFPRLVHAQKNYIVMEYVGESLIRNGLFRFKRVLDAEAQFDEIARDLRECGVAHNDVSPEELLVSDKGGVIFLVDFSNAILRERAIGNNTNIIKSYTSAQKKDAQGLNTAREAYVRLLRESLRPS